MLHPSDSPVIIKKDLDAEMKRLITDSDQQEFDRERDEMKDELLFNNEHLLIGDLDEEEEDQ